MGSKQKKTAAAGTVAFEAMESRTLMSYTPAGPEFAMNTGAGNQYFGGGGTKVAADAAGNFVATWSSYGQDGSEYGIYARRFDAAGNPLGAEFQVNNSTAGPQDVATVAVDADGDFVIAWHGPYPYRRNTLYGVYARRFAPDGTPKGDEFRVSTVYSDQLLPSVATDAAGNFVVAWQSVDPSSGKTAGGWGIYARRFDAAGAPVGDQFRVNTHVPGGQVYARAAMDEAGNFVVAWHSGDQDGSGTGVYAKRFTVSGETGAVTAGPEFRANTYTTSDQSNCFVGLRPDGGEFTIGWRSLGQDGDKEGVYAQRFDREGLRVGAEFQVNTTTRGAQAGTAVAYDNAGNSVIAWTDNLGPDSDVYAQAYDASGNRDAGEMVLHSDLAGQYIGGYLAFQPDGNFVAAFRGPDPAGSGDVFARRFVRDAGQAAPADSAGPFSETPVTLAPATEEVTANGDPITEQILA